MSNMKFLIFAKTIHIVNTTAHIGKDHYLGLGPSFLFWEFEILECSNNVKYIKALSASQLPLMQRI